MTSGTLSPSTGRGVALAYVSTEVVGQAGVPSELGVTLEVDCRGKTKPAQVVALPFFKA